MMNVLMVFPRFNQNSFWSLQAACELYGARCPAPPLGLMTVAALLPGGWNIRLVDRNAVALEPADLRWADMVMTGGMLPQRHDALQVIALCRSHARPVVVGGPDATSSPEAYQAADFLVLGEAEGVLHRFVEAWTSGERSGRFEAEKFKVDVAQSPVPRFDLIDARHYLYVGVQFSRGCPFHCEFCDIIELYGHVPRTKTNGQMLGELQALYDRGYRGQVDFVDDNLIGNKKALKNFLPALAAWQERHGYPFFFSTEASINLADDERLLDMMRQANFFAVFVGIESPDPQTLVQARKKQNAGRSLADSVHRIQAAGMMVLGGFIVGFDTERDGVAEGMIRCIEDTGIAVCMVGLLTALPGTQLTRRLEREGRLLPFANAEAGDQCTAGLNFVPLRPRRVVLAEYRAVLEAIYDPASYFERVRRVGRRLRPGACGTAQEAFTKDMLRLLRLMARMTIQKPGLRRFFWRTFLDIARHNPAALRQVVTQMTLYLHLGPFAAFVGRELGREIAVLDEASPPPPRAVAGGSLVSS